MITIKIESMFFDREPVRRAIDRAKRAQLSRGGALVRKIAMNSIKSKPYGVYSPPGNPPYSHLGFMIRKWKKQRRQQGKPVVGYFKGLKQIVFGYDKQTESCVVGPTSHRTGRVTNKLEFGNHPFMGPALLKASLQLPPMWRNSVRGDV